MYLPTQDVTNAVSALVTIITPEMRAMARQPFQPTYKATHFRLGPFLIDQMPEVARWVGRITVNWSLVDLQMSLLLGSLLGVENAAAVAVYQTLRVNRDKRAALKAAAKRRISGGSLQAGFEALLAIHERLDRQRNDYVHGVWGIADATPDGIIWVSAQDHANALIDTYHYEKSGADFALRDQHYELTKDCFVIRYKDLADLNCEISELHFAVGALHSYIRYEDQVQGPSAWQSFIQTPVVARELAKVQ